MKSHYAYEKRWKEKLKNDPARKDVLNRLKEKGVRASRKHYQKIRGNSELWQAQLEYQKEYRNRNREKLRARWQQNYHKNLDRMRKKARDEALKLRMEVFSHYSQRDIKCALCGESDIDVLCLDHIEPALKSSKASTTRLYRQLKHEGYPPGYRVLCFNCNMKEWKNYLGKKSEPRVLSNPS